MTYRKMAKGNDSIRAAMREREERVLDAVRVANSEGHGYETVLPTVPWRNALDRLVEAGVIFLNRRHLDRRRGYWVRAVLKAPCRCRLPRRHQNCAHCGVAAPCGGKVCGVCRHNGIDGKLIPGTGRVVCSKHR
jgi:hypothetical protein